MKITKKRLTEIIRQELKEFSGTRGGSARTQRIATSIPKGIKTADTTTKAKKVVQKTKADVKTTKQRAYDTAASDEKAAMADYNQRVADLSAHTKAEPHKYQWTRKGTSMTGNKEPRPGTYDPGSLGRNSSWESWDAEKTSKTNKVTLADRARELKAADKRTKSAEKSTADTEWTAAAADAEKWAKIAGDRRLAQKAAERAADYGFSMGGAKGGSGFGKGKAAGKASGKKGGKKGKKKDESLFRILGRDLVQEMYEIDKLKK